MDYSAQKDKTILITQKTRISNVRIENINFIKCHGEVSTICFVDKRNPIVVSRLLKKFEIELKQYGFIRSTHNILINIYQIHELKNSGCREIIMKNDEIVKVSVRKLPKIKHILTIKKQYL